MLPSAVVGFLEQISAQEPRHSLVCSSKDHHICEAHLSDLQGDLVPLGLAAANGFAYIICCDGSPSTDTASTFTSASMSTRESVFQLFKVGTGMCGTDLGRVYVKSQRLPHLFDDPDEGSPKGMARIFLGTLSSSRLVAFSNSAPNSVVCFSTENLCTLGKISLIGENHGSERCLSPHVVTQGVPKSLSRSSPLSSGDP